MCDSNFGQKIQFGETKNLISGQWQGKFSQIKPHFLGTGLWFKKLISPFKEATLLLHDRPVILTWPKSCVTIQLLSFSINDNFSLAKLLTPT